MLMLVEVPIYPKMTEDDRRVLESFRIYVSAHYVTPSFSPSFCILCISFADCGSTNATATPPPTAMKGSSGGEGALCIPNGDKVIEFLGFNAVS